MSNIYDLVEILMKSDPAVYRVMFFDPSGSEIYQFAKTWNSGKKYSSIGSMMGQIFNNADKFFGFMKRSVYDKFTFYWFFENSIIIAADTSYGFIALLCENDVDLGFVKNILIKQGIPIYERVMKPIQD